MNFFGMLLCLLFDVHVPVTTTRHRPRREVSVCKRCGRLLVDDPWDSDRFDDPEGSL